MWTNKYVGIPFLAGGRDFDGVDCWGLACLIYKNEYSIDLPSFAENYAIEDTTGIEQLIKQYREGWTKVEEPKPGDLLVFRVLGFETHVGIALDGDKFIHSREGNDVAIATLNDRWKHRLTGYYRYTTEKTLNYFSENLPEILETKTLAINPEVSTTLKLVLLGTAGKKALDNLVVYVNDRVVNKDAWDLVYLKSGDVVKYRQVAGKDAVRLVAIILIAVYAPYIANYLYTAATGTATWASAFTSGAFASQAAAGLATAAVTVAGSFLLNAIAPIRPPTQATPESTEAQLMISGSANRATPYEAIPVILGTVRITPPLAAQSYITYPEDRVSYLNLAVAWGFGPLQIGSQKIGEVAIGDFTIQDQVTLTGYQDASADVTKFDDFYSRDVEQRGPQIELICEGNPETEVSPGEYIERASQQLATEISVAFHMPQGMRKIKNRGDDAGTSFDTSVQIQTEYKVGSGAWTAWETFSISGNKKDAYTITRELNLNIEPALLQVRARRLTGDNTEDNDDWRYMHSVVFLTATFINHTSAIKNPPNCFIARSAYKIKAEGQLSNQIEGINAIVTSRCRPISATPGNNYSLASNNPAVLFFHILTHPANPQRVLDSEIADKINVQQLQYWQTYCDTARTITYTDNNGQSHTKNYTLTYNGIVSTKRSLMETLKDVCAAGRASPAFIDGKWTVTIDEPKSMPVQYFTPHNSWGFEGVRALPKEPDGLKVTFFDAEQNYQESETIIYNTGKSAQTAELFEAIQLPGVTSRAEVVDHAKWQLAQAKLRREIYTINADLEYLVCNRGDRVKVTHDVPAWGLASGRVRANFIDSSNSIYALRLTELVPIQHPNTYTIRVRNNLGSSTTHGVRTSITVGLVWTRENNIVKLKVTKTWADVINVGDRITFNSSTKPEINVTNAEILNIEPIDNTDSWIYFAVPGPDRLTNQVGTVQARFTDSYDYVFLTLGVLATDTVSLAADNLFMFGAQNQETQDLIILSIEPQSNKTAKLTLMDYGVTSTYNIFTDYKNLSENTVFETQITLPPQNLQNSFNNTQRPIVTAVFSDDRAADMISPGVYEYNIKISFATLQDLPVTVRYVQLEYAFASESDQDLNSVRTIYSDFTTGTITIPKVVVGETYKYRLRYVTSDNRVGPWSTWATHQVVGRENNYGDVDSVSVTRIRRFLHVTPQIAPVPIDFSHFEIKIFKDAGTGDFWDSTNSTIITTKTTSVAIVDLKQFASPRLSETGIKYRIACRAVDSTGNYSNNRTGSTSALTSITLTTIPS